MPRPISNHIRANAVAYVALFLATTGGAYAVMSAPKNSVVSKSIRNGQVRSADLRNGGVKGVDVKDGSLTGRELAADSLTGANIDESTLNGVGGSAAPQGPQGPPGPRGATGPQGPTGTINGVVAGGDLTGTYPNPQISAGAVGGPEVADHSLSDNDIGTFSQTAINLPNVPANGCIAFSFALSSYKQVGEAVFIQAADGTVGSGSGTGLIIGNPYIVTDSSPLQTGKVCNVTGSDIDAASEAFDVWSINAS